MQVSDLSPVCRRRTSPLLRRGGKWQNPKSAVNMLVDMCRYFISSFNTFYTLCRMNLCNITGKGVRAIMESQPLAVGHAFQKTTNNQTKKLPGPLRNRKFLLFLTVGGPPSTVDCQPSTVNGQRSTPRHSYAYFITPLTHISIIEAVDGFIFPYSRLAVCRQCKSICIVGHGIYGQ